MSWVDLIDHHFNAICVLVVMYLVVKIIVAVIG